MSIASQITRLQNIKTDIRNALVAKGVTSASSHNMADFAADISSISSGGATITVTYDSSFYNKTMTCTKGTKIYTKTTTSSGSTTFNVNEEGTWTITCNGVSRTVNVVLSYSTQMAITQTVTVYSAASDTVSFTDATGAKTVTTDTSGRGSVTISFIPNSTITFTSSKAKNPTNLSQAYNKTITMTDSITSVYVMPDNVLYWYGYNSSKWNIVDGWTKNTNYMQANGSANNKITYNDTINAGKLYLIAEYTNNVKTKKEETIVTASDYYMNGYIANNVVYLRLIGGQNYYFGANAGDIARVFALYY